MNFDGFVAIVFIILLAAFLWRKRKHVNLQKALFPIFYVVMYRSSLGLSAMSGWAKKYPRVLKALADLGVILGFLGMVLICVQLIYITIQSFTVTAQPGVQLVLPIDAKGVFYVPFTYWILSIFLLAVVHEFAHGVIARLYNIPVKSSGFAFLCILLPVVPAAFVEPDEKVLQKKSYRQQLGVFAAGPFSNMLFALVSLILFLLLSPVQLAAFDTVGVEVTKITDGSPAEVLSVGDIMTEINQQQITNPGNVSAILQQFSPNESVLIKTNKELHNITLGSHPENSSQPYFGVQLKSAEELNQEFALSYGSWTAFIVKWFNGLLFWLFMLNLGIGLFNLLPLGPVDGGRMFQLVCFKLFKNKQTALLIWKYTGLFFLFIILINVFMGFF